MSKIYVASSWRNQIQPLVVQILKMSGYEVYDFKKPRGENTGFHWSEIDTNWKNWSLIDYRNALLDWKAEKGFKSDMDAMIWADE